MGFAPTIILTGFAVEYVDMRAPKPRDNCKDTFVLDAATIEALGHTGRAVPDFIRHRYELGGLMGDRRERRSPLASMWTKARCKNPEKATWSGL